MAKNTVQYVASLPHERDDLKIGRNVGNGACVSYYRFGRLVTGFVASPRQLMKISSGRGKIQITDKAIAAAHRRGCPVRGERNPFAGAKKRRRR